MRISDWSSDVCSSDLASSSSACRAGGCSLNRATRRGSASITSSVQPDTCSRHSPACGTCPASVAASPPRSEEHTSELQSLMRISYAVFCLEKKKYRNTKDTTTVYSRINDNTSHI